MSSLPRLGEKIRYFRERAGLSQLDLEVAIDASTGSISRMENNHINPTKETLLTMADALNLNKSQLTYLLDIASGEVSMAEVDEVLEKTHDYYDSESNIGFILDDHWNLVKFSKGFLNLIEITALVGTSLEGTNIMDLLFDPQSPINRKIQNEYFGTFAEYVISRKQAETQNISHETWLVTLTNRLMSYPKFKVIWNKVKISPREYLSNQSRTMYFNTGNTITPMLYSREFLKDFPRFIIFDYTRIN